MIHNRALDKYIIGFIAFMMIASICIGVVSAQESEGGHVVAGRVYTSDGDPLTDPSGQVGRYNGTFVKVIILHDDKKTSHLDENGIELGDDGFYWYNVYIPQGAWRTDDMYWVWIDGTPWGDEEYYCRGAGDKDVDHWKITSAGSEMRDVQTVDYIPENIKPMIAMIFALILAVFGIIVGSMRPMRLAKRPKHTSDLDEALVIPVAVSEVEAAEKAAPPKKEEPKAAVEAPPKEPEKTEAVEKRTCATCEGELEYIEEYDSWYCDKCQKYEGEEAEPVATEEPAKETVPEAEEEAPKEEEAPADVRTCPQCGGNLEFVKDYDAWYCYTCQKYEEELTGEGEPPSEGGGEQ